MEIEELRQEIVRQSRKAEFTLESGLIETGVNGPYKDPETKYRWLAHWACTYECLFAFYHDERCIWALERIRDELIEGASYSQGLPAYCCRSKEGKDTVNGTIGPAWIILGLMAISRCLSDGRASELAVKLFLSLDYVSDLGVWKRREVDGSILWCDETFNHQLWFAAAGADILRTIGDTRIQERVLGFLDKCMGSTLFEVYTDGLVRHYTCIPGENGSRKVAVRRLAKNRIRRILNKPNMEYKEQGYHCFALYGFALIHRSLPDHPIFKSKKMKKAIAYAFSKSYIESQVRADSSHDGTLLAQQYGYCFNIYGFAYNSPAFELPFISQELTGDTMDDGEILELLAIQSKLTGWPERLSLDLDYPTLESRVYELSNALFRC